MQFVLREVRFSEEHLTINNLMPIKQEEGI